MHLEDLKPGSSVRGLENNIVVISSVTVFSPKSVQVVYKTADGALRERLLDSQALERLEPAGKERPWSFEGDGDQFKLAVEAKRIDLAYLFDPMMAVHTSSVEPLPHQITAVYEAMLPKQPLRFVLADDPGAGKTIMAGLYIRELVMRADAKRILVVSPGSLVEQWRDELYEKFGLEFHLYTKADQETSVSGNAFEDFDQVIVRLDMMARNEEEQEKVCRAGWDLVIFDEAHKLAAHFTTGQEIKKTQRFNFAEKIGASTRHLLLMTATPHNGKEEDFQLFLSLLDSDRFYGKFRDGVHKVETSDLMRRMVKEELVKFDGTRLFPERRAYTMNYILSRQEVGLYEMVTSYVKDEMSKASELSDKRRGNSVGFALTSLQRRLASSPEAIYQSLKRRKARLEKKLEELKFAARGQAVLAEVFQDFTVLDEEFDADDLNADEQENLEEELIDRASAAVTIAELETEIKTLGHLVEMAKTLVASGEDRKWEELSRILQRAPELRDADGRMRKIIIFTEHRDTLNYLHQRIGDVLGTPQAIVTIHGGTHRDERRAAQERFRSEPEVRVLVATDAAGEGVNLQNANLMVNYDLPWNPNRLEQRFGRIHRIGQQEVCHLWSLVAKETREGAVYHQLLVKLEVESKALNGRVFDILGEAFEERSLKDMLIEAIRYGDRADVRAKLTEKVAEALDTEHLQELLKRNALAEETMSPDRLFQVRDEMEKAEARRLQPFFIQMFFRQAFEQLGGTLHKREAGRFEISFVPAAIRDRDREITGRNTRNRAPVLKKYERICFTKEAVQPMDRPGVPYANLIHPGHPLMLAVTDLILEQNLSTLKQGTILVDPLDEGNTPWLMFLLSHEVKAGQEQVISKRLQFIRVNPDGSTEFAGWAPHLDLEPLAEDQRPLIAPVLNAQWLDTDLEQKALTLAAETLAPQHFQEVASRRVAHIEKTLEAVHVRLTTEIDYWSDRYTKLVDDKAAGKDVRILLENVRRRIGELESRLASRKKELEAMRSVYAATPVSVGGALVLPQGLLRTLTGDEPAPDFTANAQARARIERLAMQAVQKAEEARGCRVKDVSADKCGWDLTSYPPAVDGVLPPARHIEVKGRVAGAKTVTVTSNEIRYSFNQGVQYLLALVFVHPDDSVSGPYLIPHPFDQEPGWGVCSVNYDISKLLEKALPV